MFAIVLLTLSRTTIASFSTDLAHLSVESRIARHEPSAQGTSVSTVSAQLDTLSHHLYHVTAQASIGTHFAIAQTLKTILNTSF